MQECNEKPAPHGEQGRGARPAGSQSAATYEHPEFERPPEPRRQRLRYAKPAILFQARLEAVASFCAEPAGKSEYQCMTVNS